MFNVMIDLETMGTTPEAAVLSIGAVYFDLNTGELGPDTHIKLDFVSACKDRMMDPDTVKWWLTQDEEAQKALLRGANVASQADAITTLSGFLWASDIVVWGNGATFDISILENWFRQRGHFIPWKFYNVRDMRTVVAMAEDIISKDDIPFQGVKHDALDDAKHQARVVSAMWQKLRT